MLNVSQMHAMTTSEDMKYPNITILTRPLKQSPPSTPSTPTPLTTTSITSQDSQTQSSAVVSSPLTTGPTHSSTASDAITSVVTRCGSLTAPTPQQHCNGSQSVRSTVLANNDNTSSCVDTTTASTAPMAPMAGTVGTDCAPEEKSPMCLINEICRHNGIKQEYLLVDESGPPHDKTFTVALKLGDTEEYRGSGASIKKAQRSAATLGLQRTQLKQPTPRQHRTDSKNVWPLTPTVELNVLAMKLGQNAVYHVYDPPRPQAPTYSFGSIGAAPMTATNAYDFRGMHYQRYRVPRGLYSATLTIGAKQFTGKGRTAQAARHAAAEEALKELRQTPLPSNELTVSSLGTTSATGGTGADNSGAKCSNKSPISVVHEMALHRNLCVRFDVVAESGPSHMPLFVTQCTVGHLVTKGDGNCKRMSKNCSALRMIEELRKIAPIPVPDATHTPNTHTPDKGLTDGDTGSTNNGRSGTSTRKKYLSGKKHKRHNNNNNKSIIKDNANEHHMSDKTIQNELIAVNSKCESNGTHMTPNNNCQQLTQHLNHESAVGVDNHGGGHDGGGDSGIAVCVSGDGHDAPIHPINRLIQLQQARKEKDPQFVLISERCLDHRRREFTIECKLEVCKGGVGGQLVSAVGVGPNKKLAKKNAAEAMLQVLGYSSRPVMDMTGMSGPTSPQSILKQDSSEALHHKKIRQVKFVENDMTCGAHVVHSQPKLGRQLVPGLILMPTNGDVTLNRGFNTGLSHSSEPNSLKQSSEMSTKCNANNGSNVETVCAKLQSISIYAKELLASKLSSDGLDVESGDAVDVDRVDQLKSLSEAIGANQFQVHFSDFPKKHSNSQSTEYLSVITMTTVWNERPIVSHGSGPTQDVARNQASHQALIQLSQLDSTQLT
ncbi:unnamed protein product [Oppiella nova]|uniref:DRBM domain-containing protein n=1 Tax=Oppiella nova TaxID=334625 RepID=A0A7R9M4X6_9ACAR|nr:unnamed protein product [Oppiella nova]CAG2169537.1 unnamed protein product [Oppiella nova]